MRVRHSKGLALVGACILFAMSLAACGNSDTAADAANTASSAEVRTVAESSAAAPAETTADLSGFQQPIGCGPGRRRRRARSTNRRYCRMCRSR